MILIIAPDDDAHANMVAQGLAALEIKHRRWSASCSPFEQNISMRLDDEPVARVSRNAEVWAASDISVVWYRREGDLTPPAGLLHENFDVFRRETISSYRGFFSLMNTAFWVNNWVSAWQAENKVFQLGCAKSVGFSVPRTLISNSPNDIRQFYSACDGKTIHKMFYQAGFNNGTQFACTNLLSPAAIAQTKSLEICPGIYQEQIAIAFEVRACVFGETVLAAKLVPNTNKIDIRVGSFSDVTASPFNLPELVVNQCIALVQRMQLVSGSIDLAFTQDGRWIFFEVNQSGQFIWLELLVPELPLLDAFCRFLSHGDRAFRYTRQERCLSAPDFLQPDSSAPPTAHE